MWRRENMYFHAVCGNVSGFFYSEGNFGTIGHRSLSIYQFYLQDFIKKKLGKCAKVDKDLLVAVLSWDRLPHSHLVYSLLCC